MLAALLLLAIAQPNQLRPIGTVVIGADGTGTCPGTIAEDECRLATISAVGVEAQVIDLKIMHGTAAVLGTVVLLAGGGSGGMWESQGATAESAISTLIADHYNVIEAVFDHAPTGFTQTGWNVSAHGMKAAAGRGATLFAALKASTTYVPAGRPLCLVAQSGGGLLAAMALIHYGQALDGTIGSIVTAGGPVPSREDYHCLSRINAAFSAICDARQLTGGGGGCTGIPPFTDDAWGFDGVAGDCAHQSNRGNIPWLQDSLISGGANYNIGTVKWHFVFGATDHPDIAVVHGRLLEDQLSYYNAASAYDETSVAATPHAVASTAGGATQIVTFITTDCL